MIDLVEISAFGAEMQREILNVLSVIPDGDARISLDEQTSQKLFRNFAELDQGRQGPYLPCPPPLSGLRRIEQERDDMSGHIPSPRSGRERRDLNTTSATLLLPHAVPGRQADSYP